MNVQVEALCSILIEAKDLIFNFFNYSDYWSFWFYDCSFFS